MSLYILINCSGKCGSQTLFNAFDKRYTTQHCHSLFSEGKNNGKGIWHQKSVSNELKRLKSNDTVVHIDSFRNPIDRKISSFFQNITTHMSMTDKQILRLYHKKGIVPFIIRFNKLAIDLENYWSSYDWKQLYGYDILDEEFKNKSQIKIIDANESSESHGYKKIFINIRFSDAKEWSNIINSIGIPELKHEIIISHNHKSNEKWYKNIYNKFISVYRMPMEIYNSIFLLHKNYIEHFYYENELNEFMIELKKYNIEHHSNHSKKNSNHNNTNI